LDAWGDTPCSHATRKTRETAREETRLHSVSVDERGGQLARKVDAFDGEVRLRRLQWHQAGAQEKWSSAPCNASDTGTSTPSRNADRAR
jgi:hypothetical protein